MNTPKEIAIVTAAGVAAFGFFGWPVLRAHQARQWPHAVGKITAVEVTRQSDSTAETNSKNYTVTVNYEYSVAGTKYTNKRVTFFSILMQHRTQDLADKQRAIYPDGSMIKVLYNPKNPADAVLETNVPWTFYFAVSIGAIFIAGGLITMVRMLI